MKIGRKVTKNGEAGKCNGENVFKGFDFRNRK